MAAKFRALLIGVPAYDDQTIDPLPCISDDLVELRAALESVGYEVEQHPFGQTDRDRIETAIELFLVEERPDATETRLVFLSGHGMHLLGQDYLVPRGADKRVRDFATKCIAVDFDRFARDGNAANVVIMIDACREGLRFERKSAPSEGGWAQRPRAPQSVVYVYACSAGEVAHYVRPEPDKAFSFFSRALSTVIRDDPAMTLAEVEEAIQPVLDDLTARYNRPPQQVAITAVSKNLRLFPRAHRGAWSGGEHPWVDAVRQHSAWRWVTDDRGKPELQDATERWVRELSRIWEKAQRARRPDPWHEYRFASRMSARSSFLVSGINKEKLELSAAEAAVLVLMPFLHATFWAAQANLRAPAVQPADLTVHGGAGDRASFEHYLEYQVPGFDRLARRAKAGTDAGGNPLAQPVGWWLFHGWLATNTDSYNEDLLVQLVVDTWARTPVPGADGPWADDAAGELAREVFSPGWLMKLLKAMRLDPLTVARPDRDSGLAASRMIAAATDHEQRIRERMLGCLLVAAEQFAIGAARLPDIVVNHLGVEKGARLDDLLETLATAKWIPRGRGRVLTAACRHPAVDLALREHVTRLDALLRQLDRIAGEHPDLAALADLPMAASPDGVLPERVDGRRLYESDLFRFRLADDRIQELLMGEQLYGDSSLAIRELYQNALDACRYRQARRQYLAATEAPLDEWEGLIVFRQGVENGRRYLECADNGIGMGMGELINAFSQAGVRFADLPEYVEEQSDWRRHGIVLEPNSRFGIGVLSYFMLADDITVTTCRLDRLGRPTRRYTVTIAGPGSLFLIRDEGPGHESGTTVRLYLRADAEVSCVDLLRRVLWIADFRVRASDQTAAQDWAPGVLAPSAPIGAEDPLTQDIDQTGAVDATADPAVWWSAFPGGVLVDGLWAGTAITGAVVNLRGAQARLTVDRRTLVDYDKEAVNRLLRQQIDALFAPGAGVLSFGWLIDLTDYRPRLADSILLEAAGRHYRWPATLRGADVAIVGCFEMDLPYLGSSEPRFAYKPSDYLPDWLAARRIAAWVSAGIFPALRVIGRDAWVALLALPTDARLLDTKEISLSQPGPPIPPGHIASAAVRSGQGLAAVVERLRAYGFRAFPDALPSEVQPDDLKILSADLDARKPWRDPGVQVPLGRVASIAAETGRSLAEVVERLHAYGFRVSGEDLPDEADPDDIEILNGRADGQVLDLDSERSVPPGYVALAVLRSGRSPADVVGRLRAYGCRELPETLPEDIEPGDPKILIGDLDGTGRWPDLGTPVPLGYVAWAALETGRGVAAIVERLRAYGFRDLPEVFPERGDPDDARFLGGSLEHSSWPDPAVPVPLGYVAWAARETGRGLAEVVERLRAYGFGSLPEAPPGEPDPDDAKILAGNEIGRMPWLDPEAPVPLGLVLRASMECGRSPAEIAERLRAYGFHHLPPALPTDLDLYDREILSMDLDGRAPWLEVSAPVSLGHLVRAAGEYRRSPVEIADRLRAHGFRQLPENLPPDRDFGDVAILGSYGESDSISGVTIPLGHIVNAAFETRRSPAEVVTRLRLYGFRRLPELRGLPVPVSEDARLLSRDLDASPPWLSLDEPIPAGTVAQVLARPSWERDLRRLLEYGFRLPDWLVLADEGEVHGATGPR